MKIIGKNIILLLLIPFIASAITKFDLYNEIAGKFENINSISFNFVNKEGPGGKITAARNNQYIIELPGRHIVSDGENVWNYSIDNNTVMISKFDEHSSQLSVEQLFFELLNKSKPENLEKITSSEGGKQYKLTLDPSESAGEFGIKNIKLYLSTASKEIRMISYTTDTGTFHWIISDLKTGISTNKTQFKFSPPENAEVIDLR